MEKKTMYKAILNIGYKDENAVYFDRLTNKRFKNLLEQKNYIILYFDKFFQKYVVFDRSSKLNEYQKALFNGNIEYYCG